MKCTLHTLDLSQVASLQSDALVVLLPSGFTAVKGDLGQLIANVISAGDASTECGKVLSVYLPAQLDTAAVTDKSAKKTKSTTPTGAKRLVLVGVGQASGKEVKKAVGAALVSLKASPVQSVALVLSALDAKVAPDAVRHSVAAALDALYVYCATKPTAKPSSVTQLDVYAPVKSACDAAFKEALAIAQGVELAKELANRPGNHATPTALAKAAQELAKAKNISVEVLGPKEVAKLKMGAFMAVAQGAAEELRFIVLQYKGLNAKTPKDKAAPTVLVGKGITFDTGGISLKPGAEMDEMKFDMAGSASVLGVFKALAVLQPAINVVGLIPATENMPDGKAVKPGDVVTSMSGQTIEILNTDAEGRLVLCDALTYAERFKPRAVIDIATLTGACVIALGGHRSGLFASDDALADSLIRAGEQSQDLCWRMPLDDEYYEGLKSNFADMANVAGRAGGAITAAKFLHQYTKAYPWAHLDIAGSAWKSGAAKGGTGRPVGLLMQYLLQQAV